MSDKTLKNIIIYQESICANKAIAGKKIQALLNSDIVSSVEKFIESLAATNSMEVITGIKGHINHQRSM